MSTTTEIRFVSSNPHKIREARLILERVGISIIPVDLKIEELQTTDASRLVQDKLLKAFNAVGRPLFVEHTGLLLSHLGGFPGGLTQIFWDSLRADRFAELFGKLAPDRVATALTTVAYCDGRNILEFKGSVSGEIVPEPRGPREFQWDSVFQPKGFSETFAELGDKKNEISMRKLALDQLAVTLAGAARP